MRIVTHRTVNKQHLAATVMEFLHEESLVDILAREPVRRRDEDLFEEGEGRSVAQPV